MTRKEEQLKSQVAELFELIQSLQDMLRESQNKAAHWRSRYNSLKRSKVKLDRIKALAIVEAARQIIAHAGSWKQDQFYIAIHAMAEAVRDYDVATKAGEGPPE